MVGETVKKIDQKSVSTSRKRSSFKKKKCKKKKMINGEKTRKILKVQK